MTLYDRLLNAGCQLDHHESDLYVRADRVAVEILKSGRLSFSYFISPIDGRVWAYVQFAYAPFWEKATSVAARREAMKAYAIAIA